MQRDAVMPAKAGIHADLPTLRLFRFSMGPSLRWGDGEGIGPS
jgi:hypothetical protein